MPRGRLHVPQSENDGKWFVHRNCSDESSYCRENTSTGSMLNDPFDPVRSCYPPNPPVPYQKRAQDTLNFFSAHDNRNVLQDVGEYFGDGASTRLLGRKTTAPIERMHFTETDALKDSNTELQYDSTYNRAYTLGNKSAEPARHRRFPTVHTAPSPGLASLTTSLDKSEWRSTNFLVNSRLPYPGPTKWKYSYQDVNKCYPPYDQYNRSEPFSVWTIPGKSVVRKRCASQH